MLFNPLVLGKICLPKYSDLPEPVKEKFNNVVGDIGIDDIAQSLQDITNAWPVYIIAFFTCLVITYDSDLY